jgi:hypothetical protein
LRSFAYLVGDLILLLFFGLLYFFRPEGRKAMRWTAAGMAPAGPLSEYWHRDYWQPLYLLEWRFGPWRFGVEDLLFSFAFAGLSAGVFAWVKRRERQGGALFWPLMAGRMALRVALVLILLGLGVEGARWNSIYASMASFLLLSLLVLLRRPDLLLPALATGGIAALGMWAFYAALFTQVFPGIFSEWWRLEKVSGISLLGVPLEEPAWAFFGGLFCGLLFPSLEGLPAPVRYMKVV